MAANVLNSPQAVRMSVEVVRAFVRLRRAVADYKELAARLDAVERKSLSHDDAIKALIATIRQLMTPPEPEPKPAPKPKRIGFTKPD